MKKSMNNSNTLQVSFLFISSHLEKFLTIIIRFLRTQNTAAVPVDSCIHDFWRQFCDKKCGVYMDVYGPLFG